ncbi:hypothetical protein CQA53_10895, partial [Helicobacter didelphidarum]
NSQNLSNIDYNEVGLHGDALTHYIITLLTPAKANKIEIHLAHGLDSMIESKDIDIDSHILKCNIINGGHSERLWGEEDKNSKDTDSNANSNNTDKDSNQDSPLANKQIHDMYFSYGEDCKRIKNNSKCQDDLNLHIITKDYKDGEYVEINANINGNTISLKGRVKDNEIIFMNALKDIPNINTKE